jgi:ribonuclease HI
MSTVTGPEKKAPKKRAAAAAKDASTKRVKQGPEKPADAWTLQFDGASRPNPGPSGAGWVLYDAKMDKRASGYKYLGAPHTNNVAEYSAAIAGLKYVLSTPIKPKNVWIQGDSSLVIGQVFKGWKCNMPHLRVLLNEARSLIDKLKPTTTCFWEHIPREDNTEADLLSNIAIDSKMAEIKEVV